MDPKRIFTDVTLVIPAYNEEQAIAQTIAQVPTDLKRYGEVLVVDDGSKDATYELAKKCGVRVIRHLKNKGKYFALETGINEARGHIIVTIDADCTYPAGDIHLLVKGILDGNDLMVGSRFKGVIIGMPVLNRMGNMLLSQLASIVAHKKFTDAQSGFRAFRKDLFFRLNLKSKSLEMETEMTTKAVKYGFRMGEIPIHYKERVGKSKLNPMKDGWRMFKAIVRIAFFERSVL